MDLTPIVPQGRQYIDGYGPGLFRVAGQVYPHSIIVMPERTLAWHVGSGDGIDLEGLAPVMDPAAAVEVLLVGTGERMALLPRSLREGLKAAGVGVETMATGPACRTYNVLLAEERRVAAALVVLP